MATDTITWSEYLEEMQRFLKISENLDDDWKLVKNNDNVGNAYLMYKQKVSYNNDADQIAGELPSHELLQMEYHIVYSVSYQVPVLYFRAYKPDGSLVGLEDAWRIFSTYTCDTENLRSRTEMLSILTQMDHPVLFRPYLALHPCRTAELLAQAGKSRNRILTFVSLMGPFVKLRLRNEYGLMMPTIK